MGRAPCCEKVGLNKGPWTKDEDDTLISYIKKHGHPNWRALPKLAGLLRCGKSCRLRWTNYLRPDIKRGNFTPEEEHTIFYLHQVLGNRWSAIAARLPGRTDNEIKNVWHTRLKKRLNKSQLQVQATPVLIHDKNRATPKSEQDCDLDTKPDNDSETSSPKTNSQIKNLPDSPLHSSSSSTTSDGSSSPISTTGISSVFNSGDQITFDNLPEDSFWSDVLSQVPAPASSDDHDLNLELSFSPLDTNLNEHCHFWVDLFSKANELL